MFSSMTTAEADHIAMFCAFWFSVVALIVSITVATSWFKEEKINEKNRLRDIEKAIIKQLNVPPPDGYIIDSFGFKWAGSEKHYEEFCLGHYGKNIT